MIWKNAQFRNDSVSIPYFFKESFDSSCVTCHNNLFSISKIKFLIRVTDCILKISHYFHNKSELDDFFILIGVLYVKLNLLENSVTFSLQS